MEPHKITVKFNLSNTSVWLGRNVLCFMPESHTRSLFQQNLKILLSALCVELGVPVGHVVWELNSPLRRSMMDAAKQQLGV